MDLLIALADGLLSAIDALVSWPYAPILIPALGLGLLLLIVLLVIWRHTPHAPDFETDNDPDTHTDNDPDAQEQRTQRRKKMKRVAAGGTAALVLGVGAWVFRESISFVLGDIVWEWITLLVSDPEGLYAVVSVGICALMGLIVLLKTKRRLLAVATSAGTFLLMSSLIFLMDFVMSSDDSHEQNDTHEPSSSMMATLWNAVLNGRVTHDASSSVPLYVQDETVLPRTDADGTTRCRMRLNERALRQAHGSSQYAKIVADHPKFVWTSHGCRTAAHALNEEMRDHLAAVAQARRAATNDPASEPPSSSSPEGYGSCEFTVDIDHAPFNKTPGGTNYSCDETGYAQYVQDLMSLCQAGTILCSKRAIYRRVREKIVPTCAACAQWPEEQSHSLVKSLIVRIGGHFDLHTVPYTE